MSLLTVLDTNALDFAGPPNVDAFDQEHFNVMAHGPSFSNLDMRERYIRKRQSNHRLFELKPTR